MNLVEEELARLQKRFQEAAKVIDDLSRIKQELGQLSIKYQDQLLKNSINLEHTQQQIDSLSNEYQEYKKYWNENFNVLIKKNEELLNKISETENQTQSKIEQNNTQLQNLEKNLDKTLDNLSRIKQELEQLSIKYQDQLLKNSINLENTQQQIDSLSNDYQEYKKYGNENFNIIAKKTDDILTKTKQIENKTQAEIYETKYQLDKLQKSLDEAEAFVSEFKNNVQFNKNLALGSFLIGFIALSLSIYSILFLPKNSPNALHSPQESSPTIASPSPDQSSIKVDFFREAVNKATRAATLAQSAKSKDDWNLVVNEWQSAIDMMKSTPSSNPNYEIAQQKVIEYQKNMNYAEQQAEQANQ